MGLVQVETMTSKYSFQLFTPGSMNSLFSDFFRELWRGILGDVRDYLGKNWEVSSGKTKGNKRTKSGNVYRKKSGKIQKILLNTIK